MWFVFADVSEVVPTSFPQIVIAVIGALGSGGVGALLVKAFTKYSDNQKDITIRRLDMEAKEKAEEAEDKRQEALAIKEASNEVFLRMKNIINRFEKENDKWGDRYEAKCVEALDRLVQLEDLQKKFRELANKLSSVESERDALRTQQTELQKNKAP